MLSMISENAALRNCQLDSYVKNVVKEELIFKTGCKKESLVKKLQNEIGEHTMLVNKSETGGSDENYITRIAVNEVAVSSVIGTTF